MKIQAGTYALILKAEERALIRVGQLGDMNVSPGYYVYVGSALGLGGLWGRLNHHRKLAARPRWHIDYLRKVCPLSEIWFSYSRIKLEPVWADEIGALPGAEVTLPGFGASDDKGASHLFYFQQKPKRQLLQQRLQQKNPEHPGIELEIVDE